ncbi:uncharacterized protein C8Q71DRAFT_727255 [Rhodofomes roseus]|uniref:Uncharacterized protein n=1 Tax=Rhodofomes roseus TaxID=34475 RepID=A0ABQ8K209_9APHY|nr:uncharacterized protein C8Q71DRAFT_727255 [Rhodofomes roseus]KAH9830780.1 hypothetical protein C8Q71DRAFT_727255 [Rhodofomes roseus]
MHSPAASSPAVDPQGSPPKLLNARQDDYNAPPSLTPIEDYRTVGQDPLSSPPSSERRSLSYAEMAANPPTPSDGQRATMVTKPRSPTLPVSPHLTTLNDAEFPAAAREVEQSGGEWHVVANKKKSLRQMKFRKLKNKAQQPTKKTPDVGSNTITTATSEAATTDAAAHAATLEAAVHAAMPNATSEASSSEPRKRRRTATDLDDDDGPRMSDRQQDPATSSTNAQAKTNEPWQSNRSPVGANTADERDIAEAMNIDFAVATESSSDESTPRRSRKGKGEARTAAPLAKAPSYSPSISVLHGREETNGHMQFVYQGEEFLFPRPPSSSPIAMPVTPSPSRGRRSHTATPSRPAKGRRWADESDDEFTSPIPPSQTSSRQSDVSMFDTPLPAPQGSSRNRRRCKQRANRRRLSRLAQTARGASSSASASLASSDDEEVPFDVDSLDHDATVPPRSLWRKPQGDRPDWKARGMAPTQKDAWDVIDDTEPVVAVQIPNHGTEEPGLEERIAAITNAFARILHLPNVAIIPAYSIEGFHGPNKEPNWYLARGLNLLVCIALVRMGWLNSSFITLNFDFWRDSNPLLCGMWRLIHRFGAQSKEEYRRLIHRELLGPELYGIISVALTRDVARGGYWESHSHDEAFTKLLDSVDVDLIPARTVGNMTEMVVVLHIKPPTAHRKDWLRFCDALRKHGFGSQETGHPIAFIGRLWCGYCHSLGHTSPFCSVRSTIGWHDDQPQQPPAQAAPPPPPPNGGAPGGRGRGRGQRGGGTQRGRGGRARGIGGMGGHGYM